MKKAIVIALSAAMLASCGSNEVKRLEAEDTIGGIDVVSVHRVKSSETVPVWYLDPGVDDESVVYASATGLADNMDFALTKAMHRAKTALGDKLAAKASSHIKEVTRDKRKSTTSRSDQSTTAVTVTSFKDVPVGGYHVVNRAIFREGSMFRAYVNLSTSATDRPAPAMSELD